VITTVHQTTKDNIHTLYFYLIIHGRDNTHPTIKIQGNKRQVTQEVKYLVLTDLVGNLSTFICSIYKRIDEVKLLSDKEVLNNLYRVLEKMVKMKEKVTDSNVQEREYRKIAKGIIKYRKELFSIVHVLGKDYGRFAQYVSLVNCCKEVIDNDVNKYFNQG